MDAAKHAQHSGSKLTERHESIGEGRGLRIKNGFTEPLVDHCAVAKQPLEQRPQYLEIKKAFRNVEDQHTRRFIKRLSAEQCRAEKGSDGGGPDPGEDGAAADMMKIAHKTAPFEGVSCAPACGDALPARYPDGRPCGCVGR